MPEFLDLIRQIEAAGLVWSLGRTTFGDYTAVVSNEDHALFFADPHPVTALEGAFTKSQQRAAQQKAANA